MTRFTLVILIYFTVLLQIKCEIQCGVPTIIKNQLIVNGLNTAPGEFPWHAAIYHRKSTTEEYKCGGTLISNWFILTAAHCVTTGNGNVLATESVFVKLGVHDLRKLWKKSAQQHDLTKIIKEPRFSSETLTHDIAMLKLASEAEYDRYVIPACLYKEDDLPGQLGTVIGYGLTEQDVLAMVLKKATMPVIGYPECLESDRDFFAHSLSDGVICAGYTNGTAACNGDSGGGLFIQKHGAWYLGGIVSHTRKRADNSLFCQTKGYAIYTKITKYLPWIHSTMRKTVREDGLTSASTNSDRVVSCYISTWAVYRSGSGSFNLDQVDPKLCTHVIYAYVGLDTENNTIKTLDPWKDLKDNYGLGGFEKLVGMRNSNPHLKVMISLGGWNEGSVEYSKLAANSQRRQTFAENALEFIKRHGFDGLDINWEYPTQRGGKPYDRENFVLLVRELSQKFSRNNLLLTSTIESKQYTIDAAYDIKNLVKYLDLLHIKSYDYKGSWNKKVGFNAPLKGDDVHNIETSIDHLIALGAPRNKIVLGIPFYGRTFITETVPAKIGDPSEEMGFSGPYTNENGFIGYNEICAELKAKPYLWQISWDTNAAEVVAQMQGSNSSKVIIYDSTRSIALKVRYAVRKNLRGVMAFSIDMDDFNGICNPEKDTFVDFSNQLTSSPIKDKYKLLRTINDAIIVSVGELNQE
ncbi:probable chitinase 2 [Armigeres subalbatus]|uniref:probable chitinase 2 n=1 Tax=Armigeres subalbatus TaxID=124917 RepID=UPI002ECFEFC5